MFGRKPENQVKKKIPADILRVIAGTDHRFRLATDHFVLWETTRF